MQDDALKRTSAIRALNDQFRCTGRGNGSWIVTDGVQAEGDAFIKEAVQAVRTFDDFNEDNDPHQEHDFGAIEVGGERLFWKIDYYDVALTMHSPNAADDSVTHRILTIMLASEW